MKKIAVATAMIVMAIGVQAAGKGDPQQQLVNACTAEARKKEIDGPDRSRFVSTCVSEGKKRHSEMTKTCAEAAAYKKTSERKAFMADCVGK